MRISLITRQKIECLSIRLEDVPGLDISTAEKLEVILVGDKSKEDWRYFLTWDTPTQGSKITKVNYVAYKTVISL